MLPESHHTAAEAALAAALLDPSRPPPAGLLGRDGGPVGRRFAVHRATTTFGLIGALATRFPVTEKLLGVDTFADLARAFLAHDRPRTALLLDWGEALPDFVARLDDLADWPFLADVGRLEVAWTRAHHAADAEPIGLDALTGLTPEDLAATRVRLHPSAVLLTSPHPVASLWASQQDGADPEAEIDWVPETVLVVRPHADVLLHRLTPAAHAFVATLATDGDVTDAALAASEIDPDFDAGAHLVGLVRLGAVVAFPSPDLSAETAP
jgi:hypothetical protein